MSIEIGLKIEKETEEALVEQRKRIIQAQIAEAQMLGAQSAGIAETDVVTAEEQMSKAPIDLSALSGVEAGNFRGHAAYRTVADMPDPEASADTAERKQYSRKA